MSRGIEDIEAEALLIDGLHTEQIVNRLLAVAPPGTLTQIDIDGIRSEALKVLRKKYPDAGIAPKAT